MNAWGAGRELVGVLEGDVVRAVGFAVLNQVTLARVFFAPAGDRLLLLADLR